MTWIRTILVLTWHNLLHADQQASHNAVEASKLGVQQRPGLSKRKRHVYTRKNRTAGYDVDDEDELQKLLAPIHWLNHACQ